MAAAGLRRVWYLAAIACPAEPGAFVVQAGPHMDPAGDVPGQSASERVNEAKADRHRSSPTEDRPGGDDGQFLLRHLPGRTRQDHGRDPGGRCPARRVGRRGDGTDAVARCHRRRAGHYGAEPGPAVYGGSGAVLRRVSAGRGAGEGDVPGMPGQAGLPGRRAGAQGALGRLGRRVADERRDRAA